MTIPEVQGPWALRPLADVCEVLDRLRRPVNAAERAERLGRYPYYGANGQVGTIDEYIFDEELVLVAEDGGFFFDPVRPIAYRVSGKCWVNNHAHVLRACDGLEPDWLCYAVAFLDVAHLVKGATRPKLNQKELREIRIPVPTLVEQRRIIARIKECASRIHEIRTLRTEASIEARALKGAIINSFIQSEWPCRRIADACLEIRNGWSGNQVEDGQEVGVLRLSCVHSLTIDDDDVKSVRVGKAVAGDFGLRAGDVLLVRGNGSRHLVARSAIAARDSCSVIFNDLLIRLRPQPDIAAEYLNYVLHSSHVREQLENSSKTAAGIWKINQQALGRIQIPVPSVETQRSVASAIEEALGAAQGIVEIVPEKEVIALEASILRMALAGEL